MQARPGRKTSFRLFRLRAIVVEPAGTKRKEKAITTQSVSPSSPHGDDADLARAALKELRRAVEAHDEAQKPVEMKVAGGNDFELPRAAADLMVRILGKMAAGQGVTVVPVNAELTTQQAADFLNVSRPYLVGLLEAGEIDFHKVGTHRRVFAEALYAYKRRESINQRDAADELGALDQDMGLI